MIKWAAKLAFIGKEAELAYKSIDKNQFVLLELVTTQSCRLDPIKSEPDKPKEYAVDNIQFSLEHKFFLLYFVNDQYQF